MHQPCSTHSASVNFIHSSFSWINIGASGNSKRLPACAVIPVDVTVRNPHLNHSVDVLTFRK